MTDELKSMSGGNDPRNAGFRATLPADLQELDRELSAIRVEERPSFGPELEAELGREWRRHRAAGPEVARPWARILLAASLAGLMLSGVAVPSARAAVWGLVRTVLEEVAPSFLPAREEAELPAIQVEAPGVLASGSATGMTVEPREISAEPESGEPFTPIREITFPRVLDYQEAEMLIESHYPLALQRAGVGGSVRLMFWVDSLGIPENVQMRESSGYRSLDYAAMRAARELRFQPATRDNVPVGTWAEFVIQFVPGPGAGVTLRDSAGSRGTGGS